MVMWSVNGVRKCGVIIVCSDYDVWLCGVVMLCGNVE